MISHKLKQIVNPLSTSVLSALLLLLSGCASTGTRPAGDPRLPPGLYVFDMPVMYERGFAELSSVPGGVRVQLLETFQGRFDLHPRGESEWVIRNDEVGYPGLSRSFSGEGRSTGPGRLEGSGEVWIRMAGPIGRDHRKGPWTLRPATAEERSGWERRQRNLQTRRRRAGMEP